MALTDGPNLGLLIDGAQGEAHYSALMRRWRGIDALVQANAIDIQNTPPSSPADGDTYIVDGSPTDDWVGHQYEVARWSDKEGEWEFYSPKEGWFVYVAADSLYMFFTGSVWSPLLASMIHVVDAENNFTSSTLEEVLAEIGSRIAALEGGPT